MKTNEFNVAVISCIRNCSNHLEESFFHIKEFQSLFKSVAFFGAENDSIDNSFEIAKKYSSSLNGEIFKFKDLSSLYKIRTHRLAFLRNFLLNKSRVYDYVIVIDMDSIMKNFDINGLKSCFEYDLNSWDGLGANCNNKYYDIWTLRNDSLNYDCWDRVNHEVQNGRLRQFSIKDHVSKHQIKINPSSELIPVKSCFGGMMIYKTSSLINCNYSGVPKKCESSKIKWNTLCISEICEHVNLNYEAIEKNKAKFFINSNLIVNCQLEHLH